MRAIPPKRWDVFLGLRVGFKMVPELVEGRKRLTSAPAALFT